MEIELGEHERAEDMLIDGLKIVQDDRLYRFTSDSVLLSRFARAKTGDRVADFCAGSGVVAFHFHALNRRETSGLSYVLFEMQPALSALSEKTAKLNGFDCFQSVNCKIQDIPREYVGSFSLILCNPPYERGGLENETYEKAVCRKELTITLKEIAAAAAKNLKYGGRLALVNRADRLAEVCYTLKSAGLEVKRLQLVTGREGAKPYAALFEAVKGGKPATEILPVLVNEKR